LKIGHAGTSAPAPEAVTAQNIIAGLTQMIERAHDKGIKVIGATITRLKAKRIPSVGTGRPKKPRSEMRSTRGFGRAEASMVS
jgi:hypothetical protein